MNQFKFSDDHFYQIIALHENKSKNWMDWEREAPLLPKGWFELSKLPSGYRIEFTHDFWLSKLPIVTHRNESRLDFFFENLEDIGIFLTQEKANSPFYAHMVYSLKDDAGFFHGAPPASEEQIAHLMKQFGRITLPPDYLAFLAIHDGFSKYTDTGLIQTKDMARHYQRFQERFREEFPKTILGEMVHPSSLIPFYESYDLHCYQCFYADWYPESEMGNVYFSASENAIMSSILDDTSLEENLAFPDFVSWLMFYLEDLFPM